MFCLGGRYEYTATGVVLTPGSFYCNPTGNVHGPAIAHEATVRPEGVDHQWRKEPPRELSVDLVADERGGRVTGRFEAS